MSRTRRARTGNSFKRRARPPANRFKDERLQTVSGARPTFRRLLSFTSVRSLGGLILKAARHREMEPTQGPAPA
jgi:hypothetical protein